MTRELIDNAEFREAAQTVVARGSFTWASIARAMGKTMSSGRGDSSRIKRMLGILPESNNHRKYLNERMTYENALSLVNALGLDPVDFDL